MQNDENKDFEIVKEKNDNKRNYIFQKDKITKTGFIIVTIILLILVVTTLYYGTKVS